MTRIQRLARCFTLPWRLFLIALVVRLVPVLAFRDLGIGLDDMFQYDMLARSIAAGDGYRWYGQDDLHLVQGYINFDLSTVDYDPRGVLTSFRPPLYPAFLAGIYLLSGMGARRIFVARLVQALMGAFLVPLTHALARRFFPRHPQAATIAAWLVVFYPMLVIYPLSLATENLFFVLVLAALLVLLHACQKRSTGWFVLSGILLGMMALTRSVSLAFAGLACLWVWFALRERWKAVILFLIISAVTAPWMIRNTLLHGRLTGIESALGYDLYVGYHPQSTGTFQYGISLDLIPILDDGERDAIGQDRAWEFIRDDPERIPYLMLRRLGYFFGLERRALTYFYSNNYLGYVPPYLLIPFALILLLPFAVVSASAFLGLALVRWRQETLLLALFMIGYLAPHVLILGEDRFHLTLVPVLAILAAFFWAAGWAAVVERWKSPSGKTVLLGAMLGVALLVLNWILELCRDAERLKLLLGPDGNRTFFPY